MVTKVQWNISIVSWDPTHLFNPAIAIIQLKLTEEIRVGTTLGFAKESETYRLMYSCSSLVPANKDSWIEFLVIAQ